MNQILPFFGSLVTAVKIVSMEELSNRAVIKCIQIDKKQDRVKFLIRADRRIGTAWD